MSNWFSVIGQSASGIDAARYGLSIVGQNIANASSTGYTRQQVEQTAVGANVSTGMYTTRNIANLEGGTQISKVDRVTDPVLDARVRDEHAKAASADTTATSMSQLEQLFPEPGTSGLAKSLDDFWTAWGTLADNPQDAGVRTTLLRAAGSAAGTLNDLSAAMSAVASSADASLTDDVARANSAATHLADLNDQIAVATAVGQNANNLLDQRDTLLDTIGQLVGGVATINANGTATVTVGGQSLVSTTGASALTVDANHVASVGGTAVTLTAGSAAARITTLTTTLPGYRSQLDAVADALSTAGNAVQTGGFDLAGNAGAALFSGSGAGGIKVVLTDPTKLAASGTAGGNLDGSNALAAAERGKATNGPDAQYRTLIAQVGSETARTQQVQTTQDALASNVDSMRAAVSGVSYDDEVTNMLTYQHAFQASSRVLTTIDEMLDTLINHTGVVGRG